MLLLLSKDIDRGGNGGPPSFAFFLSSNCLSSGCRCVMETHVGDLDHYCCCEDCWLPPLPHMFAHPCRCCPENPCKLRAIPVVLVLGLAVPSHRPSCFCARADASTRKFAVPGPNNEKADRLPPSPIDLLVLDALRSDKMQIDATSYVPSALLCAAEHRMCDLRTPCYKLLSVPPCLVSNCPTRTLTRPRFFTDGDIRLE